ncbi:putative disease resistance RPP13-like protein 1 [Malus domestica]|uniref:putative disease resistance RPP13-like protein 1 n=1 Tax=Malus domestica TaxID=3750 RepID=UPI003974777E
MVVGEILLAALLQLLIDRLEPREIRSYFGSLHGGVSKRLAKWRGSLYEIAAVLNDAEEKQLTSKAVELDNDKARIIELLSRDERPVKFEVVAIVGIPGVGKTTLAQLVLDGNSGAMDQFNPKIWEYVSDEINLEFNSTQESLSKELAGKKFLLILDDVRNTFDYELWERLQLPFRSGAPGSKIIVTTRDAKVARTMGATEVYDLQCISHDNCWKIFGQHAFKDILPNFGLLQDKVVARCSGLPLAARSLGGLLGSKEYKEWEEILNNESWSLSDEESDILPVLKLSYYYLPSSLKRRFAYCSILPNGYKFGETQLILMWMAEGLLKQPKERKDMEDTGADYFGELLSR